MGDFRVGANGPYLNKELINNIPLTKEIRLSGTDKLEIGMAKFEEFLDYAGGVPVVSTATGSVRIVYGTIQLLTAFALKIIGIFGTVFASSKNVGNWEKFSNRAGGHMQEGAFNLVRGFLELVPITNLFWWFHINARNIITQVELNEEKLFSGSLCYRKLLHTEQRIVNNSPTLFYVYADFNRAFYHGELKRMHILNQL